MNCLFGCLPNFNCISIPLFTRINKNYKKENHHYNNWKYNCPEQTNYFIFVNPTIEKVNLKENRRNPKSNPTFYRKIFF